VFGNVAGVTTLDLGPYIATAHAIIAHAPPPAAPTPARPGQRVFLTWWSPAHDAVRATGLGATLLESVAIASDELSQVEPGPGRVEIEVVTEVESEPADAAVRDRSADVGIYGYAAYDTDLAFGWVTPGEIILDKLVEAHDEHPTKLKDHDITARIEERARVTDDQFARMKRVRFKVDQRLESATPGGPPVQLVRSMPLRSTTVSADELVEAARDATDYLARGCDAQGKFAYTYDPVSDDAGKGYGMVRHAGAVYALMDAYEELHVEAWRAAAERAIGYLERELKSSPDGSWLADTTHEEQQKAGGGGLALVALAKHAEVTGDRRHLDRMRELGRFILHQQYPDGHFRANDDVKREDPNADDKQLKKEVSYYAGEATLGLIRLYAIDPDPKWLDGAKRAASYIMTVRDAKADVKHQIHDHWMSYALLDLYSLTKDRDYSDHAFKIARAIIHGEMRGPKVPAPDYVGAFFDKGQAAPSATRLEALAVDVQIARALGLDDAWLRSPATELASFTLAQQLRGDSLYFARNPTWARGAVRESLLSTDVRIDYVHHPISAWLRFSHEVRDPAWGRAK
jgi:hypothetical protein